MVRAVAAAAVLTLAPTGIAAGATEIVGVSKTATIPPRIGSSGSQLDQLPQCPGNRTAVAGGFELEFRIGDPLPPVIYPTTFRRDFDAWFMGVSNFGPGSGAVTTYAYCARIEVSVAFLARRATGQVLETTARCPSRKPALSGGFVLETVGDVPFALARKSRSAWTAAATNPAGNEAGLTAYVVCASRRSTPPRTSLRRSAERARRRSPAARRGRGCSPVASRRRRSRAGCSSTSRGESAAEAGGSARRRRRLRPARSAPTCTASKTEAEWVRGLAGPLRVKEERS
jgi:hypothetical protein